MRDEREFSKLLSTLRDTSLPDEVRQDALQQLTEREKEVQAHLRKDFIASQPEVNELQKEVNQAYDRLRPQLSSWDKQTVRPRTSPVRYSYFRKWASIAAAALALIGIAWLLKHEANKSTRTTPLAFITINNAFDTIWNTGSSTSFHRLQDGSTVHLEAGSTMFFRDSFPAENKKIFLHGSALFTVNREAKRPFSVFVNGIEVLDLGTVFSVTTKESSVRVRLIQGKVLIRSANPQLSMNEVRLAPGEEFRIDTATRQYSVNRVMTKGILPNSKLSRMLSFRNASLQEVFNSIEKECSVNIHFNKTAIKDKAFTGAFDEGSNARDMIAMICLINDLKYELQNDQLYIHN